MATITSPHNPHLKALKRLRTKRERVRRGAFLAEGEDLLAAARHAGRPALEGYRLAGCALGEESFYEVEHAALAAVSTLGSGTRAIAVYAQAWSMPVGPLCVYLHGVGDPGNVGTILRAAHAFGASCVAFGPRCADPHAPKAVRASMGAIFGVPIARAVGPRELPGERVALLAHRGEPLTELCARLEQAGRGAGMPALTLLVGAERDGLPDSVVEACEHRAHIPIAAGAESLNAAMAATVALYETTTRSSTRVRTS